MKSCSTRIRCLCRTNRYFRHVIRTLRLSVRFCVHHKQCRNDKTKQNRTSHIGAPSQYLIAYEKACPWGVSFTPQLKLTCNFAPYSFSRSLSCAETAGWLICSSFEALVSLRCLATESKIRNW